jgi:hypothetical protein
VDQLGTFPSRAPGQRHGQASALIGGVRVARFLAGAVRRDSSPRRSHATPRALPNQSRRRRARCRLSTKEAAARGPRERRLQPEVTAAMETSP